MATSSRHKRRTTIWGVIMRLSLSRPQRGYILVVVAAFTFAAKTILVKLCYRYEADPITILALRMCFAGAVFGSVLIYNLVKGNWGLRFTARQWLWLLLLALLGYYVSTLLDFMGLMYIDASLGRMILFLYPTMVVIINAVLTRTAIRGSTWLALGLCYGGIFLMMVPDIGGAMPNFWLGSFLIFLSALLYAVYLVGVDRLLEKMDPIRFTSVIMCLCCLIVAAHFLATRELSDLAVPAPVVFYGALMGLLATVLPIYAITYGISLIGASKAAMVSMIGPVLTFIMGMIVLDETLTPVQLAGMFLVMAGVTRVGK
ncbi:DMT family transporter [Deltaproteobacteria bacterium OttesenSCG-928-M10]|nr:DMT family transporter [Deltaproteobacteria bacterium OttesenSCG-928-M10]